MSRSKYKYHDEYGPLPFNEMVKELVKLKIVKVPSGYIDDQEDKKDKDIVEKLWRDHYDNETEIIP